MALAKTGEKRTKARAQRRLALVDLKAVAERGTESTNFDKFLRNLRVRFRLVIEAAFPVTRSVPKKEFAHGSI